MRRRHLLAAASLPLASALVAARAASRRLDPRQIAASTACLPNLPLAEVLDEIARLGFSSVEILAYIGARHSIGELAGFDLQKASTAERRAVYAKTRRFRRITVHLPFTGLEPLSADEALRRRSLDAIRGGVDTLAFLKGELGVLHAGPAGTGRTYRQIWRPTIETFRELGDYAGRRGCRIALETMQPSSARDYVDLIREIDHPRVGAAIDTGHIRGAADIGLPPERRFSDEGKRRFNEVLQRLVEALGERIFHVHLSDVAAEDWRDHRTIGSGIVDFAPLLRGLERMRYRGLLVFELEEPDSAEALRRSKLCVENLLEGTGTPR